MVIPFKNLLWLCRHNPGGGFTAIPNLKALALGHLTLDLRPIGLHLSHRNHFHCLDGTLGFTFCQSQEFRFVTPLGGLQPSTAPHGSLSTPLRGALFLDPGFFAAEESRRSTKCRNAANRITPRTIRSLLVSTLTNPKGVVV